MTLNSSQLLSYLGDIGVVAIALGYFWGKFYQGSNKENADAISLLEKRVKIFEDELRLAQSRILEQTKEIAHLHGVIEEKEKTLDMLKDVFAGRDPEFKEFMVLMRQAVIDGKMYQTEVRQQWSDIKIAIQELKPVISKTS